MTQRRLIAGCLAVLGCLLISGCSGSGGGNGSDCQASTGGYAIAGEFSSYNTCTNGDQICGEDIFLLFTDEDGNLQGM